MADKKKDAGDSLPEVEVLLRGLLGQPGVEGFMVFNNSGIPLKWTQAAFVKPGTTSGTSNPIPPSVVHHAALIGDLTAKAKATARRLLGEADGEVQLLRLRTKHNEMIVAPHDEATLVVLQKAHSAVMMPLIAEAATAAPVAAIAAEEKKGDK
jgi:dynein light chain roadblock-type